MANDIEPPIEKPQNAVSRRDNLHPAFYIASWIFFSNLTILFNKWLLDTAGFKYPVILTCWHLVFSTVATQILARTTTLVDGRRNVKMTGRLYLRAIVPIGLLYSASLVCSNLTYLYLSVAFIQMLKAAAPVAVLFTSWAWGVENPSMRRVLTVFGIVAGVALASVGEIHFSWLGFMFQTGGIVFEAMRLVLIQILLSEDGQKMDPLVSLYYFAPVCAVMNLIVALLSEWSRFDYADLQRTGFLILILNASIAFMLNISSVFLIGKTSSLVMTLTGILKNILLVIASVMIWNTSITFLQFFGYTIALLGLVYYSIGWDQIVTTSTGVWAYLKALWSSPSLDEGRLSPAVRRGLIMGLTLFIVGMVTIGLVYGGDDGVTRVASRQS
ncbi:triose-phosphate transporter [Thozetella sp. PMI_491]|nr:triose-phosphate transporter [Thozetella sp. PMI_491]